MSEQKQPEEKSLSEFLRIPDSLFNNAARPCSPGFETEYLVAVRHEGTDVDVRVTSLRMVDVTTARDEKLNKYSKNQDARNRAIERAFAQAASGTPVKITTNGWDSQYTAVLVRADMNG